jgi:FkbH-like protein
LADILAYNQSGVELPRGHDVSVFILRNFTIEGIKPLLVFHCLKNDIRPTVSFGEFDNVLQELIEPDSSVHRESADIVVLSLMLEGLDPSYGEPGWKPSQALERLKTIFEVALSTEFLFAVNTFIPPYDPDYGIAGTAELSERINEVATINHFIRSFVAKNSTRFILMDWERIARICGESETMDYRFWYMSKAPFKQTFLNLYALEILKVVRALKGKSKKCLLLDCDNTLWGGVVGEDGLSGIRLDRHAYPGNIYHDFQKQVLRLHERGVLLALVSKNNEEDVWEVLDHHPECLIKRKHLTAWRINWDAKVRNIEQIALELNIGIESFVFVDDSSTECELVRKMLPQVMVVQVPTKSHFYPRILARDGLFDTLSLSTEDRNRSNMYQEEAQRKQAEREFTSVDGYLASLELVATIRSVAPEDVSRIAQLTQKTNQFNLTTRRYSAAQIEAFARDDDSAVFSLSVRDRFGDSGVTGVLIAFREGDIARIDSLLLSCRVLGRNLETVFLDTCLGRLQQRWMAKEWEAEFLPSKKNSQTSDFYDRAGFTPVRSDSTGVLYRASADQLVNREILYVTVKE